VTTRLQRRHSTLPALLVLVVLQALSASAMTLAQSAPTAPTAKRGLDIFFEAQLPYYYEGDDLPVAMTVKNTTEATVDNGKGLDLMGGLMVEDSKGARLKPAEGFGKGITQPASLEQNAFFGRVLPLAKLFPGLQKAGNYKVSWKGEGASSNSLILHIVERYDPKKDYRVRFETDFGSIVIQLNKDAAPRHVRNFVDLVRQGFYNGNQFHRILPGQAIVGGSPTGDLAVGSGYNLDPETSDVPIDAGTVIQVRNRETGAMDSGSHIMILAIAKQDFRGNVSVLGKVVEGMDTVKTICQIPTVKNAGEGPGAPARPVKPVLIKRATLTEATQKVGATEAATKKPAAAKN
jgi:cyclophilin family peptidyl-prolyl cis-trans isomerase